MSNKQITTIGTTVPAFLKNANAAKLNTAAATGTGGPSINKISIKGGKFRLIVGGEEVKVLEQNSMDVAIVRAGEALHKAYYSKKWTPGSDDPPDCYSDNGERPAADAEKPQCRTCAACPHNEWGSYVNPDTGAKGRRCTDSKRLAILPPKQLGGDLPPYQMTVPAASLRSFGAMTQQLNNLNPPVPYNGVVVRVSFDTDASYPKLEFTAVDYLSEEQYAAIEARFDAQETKACIGNLIPVADVTDEPVIDQEEDEETETETPPPAPKKPAAKRKKTAKPAPVAEEAEDDDGFEEAPKTAAKSKAAPTGFDDDDAEEAEFVEETTAKAPAGGKAPAASSNIDDVFGADGWD